MDPPLKPASDWGSAVLWSALGVGAVLRVLLALGDDGIYWPDEIYQGLEPAHRLVFGYGLVAWEFADGARTYAVPAVAALVMKLSSMSGLAEPRGYLVACKLTFALLSLGAAWAAAWLARRLGARSLAAALAAAFCALAAPSLYFAPRALSEVVSALPVALGLAYALPRTASQRERIIGALLISVAVYFRLQCALVGAALLAVLVARRDRRGATTVALALLGAAAAYGLVDHLTWGGFYHSAAVYLRTNLLEGKAGDWGTASAWYYARVLFRGMPAAFVLLTALAVAGARRSQGLWAAVLLFLAVHMLTPHKELRFILPLFPLLGALAALGVEELLAATSAPLRRAGAVAAVAFGVALFVSAARARTLRFADLGQYEGSRDQLSAYDDFGDVNRLLEVAGKLPDLCGLKVEMTHLAWTGGYSYLHRRVPLYHVFGPGRESGLFNYVITTWGLPGQIVTSDRQVVLVKVGEGCKPDPAYSDRLP